ncbi:carbon-nitrogen hydrolase [Fomes fomentarius]|nr:carbon-nitrogen hydrolase [Fomes fomentarius]
MRIAVVQFAPQIGQVQQNIDKAHRLCERLQPNTVDLVCLPEMIFTGYVFPDATSISPFLEERCVGPTSRFCSSLAARLHCYVVAGYPERLSPAELEHAEITHGDGSGSNKESEDKEDKKVGANAAALYGPDGVFVGDYRKTNLYETDMSWARAGTGFTTFHLPPPLNTVSLAICMDLNSQPPAFWDYELAEYCIAQKTNLLILLNAWLDSKADPEADTDWQTINYWAMRLRPLWDRVAHEDADDDSSKSDSDSDSDSDIEHGTNDSNSGFDPTPGGRKPGDELVVVVCNRCGEENGITFAGSSSLFSMTRGSGKPRLLHAMGRRQEDAEVWTYPRVPSGPGS